MVKAKYFKGHKWTFLGNFETKAKVDETIRWHKKHIKDWGVKKTYYTTESYKWGTKKQITSYLLWYREAK